LKLKLSLSETHPEIAKQWHPTKNGNLKPTEVSSGSGKKVWWKCDIGNDHEYLVEIVKKVNRNQGCSICSGSKIVKSNCLATTHPKLSKEWHPTKNGNLKPTKIGFRSYKKVWWKCDQGDDHEWMASVRTRSDGVGCSVCYGRTIVKSNCLATTHPEIAKQWHPTKNGAYTPDNVGGGSGKKFWWKCEKGEDHEWSTSAVHRTKSKSGCPYCSNQKTGKKNNLEYLYPRIAAEWHPTKNGNLKPTEVSSGSRKKVWWKCDQGDDHIWEGSISHRTTNESGCPICSGHKVAPSTSIKILYPKLVKEWHPTLNKDKDPISYGFGSNEKIWWKCEKGDDHIWQTAIYNRTSEGTSCPFCTLTPQSKQELTITFELIKLFKSINPRGVKMKLDGKLRSIDIFIPKLNLCIEFDGSYWHKGKRELDKIKSEMIFEEGFKLIRVREEPLKKIYDTDVISKQPYNGKQVTNDILLMILSIFELDTKLVSKIKEYRYKEGLQNEKELEKYIDKILTEKSNKD